MHEKEWHFEPHFIFWLKKHKTEWPEIYAWFSKCCRCRFRVTTYQALKRHLVAYHGHDTSVPADTTFRKAFAAYIRALNAGWTALPEIGRPKLDEKRGRVNLSLPKSMVAELRASAERLGVTQGHIVQNALLAYSKAMNE